MSCFPYPRDTDVKSIRVPLIVRTQYSITGQTNLSDFLDFFEKALDAETQKIKAAESDGQESTSFSPSHSLASAIQSLLFFGIASEALGRNIRHEELAGPWTLVDALLPLHMVDVRPTTALKTKTCWRLWHIYTLKIGWAERGLCRRASCQDMLFSHFTDL